MNHEMKEKTRLFNEFFAAVKEMRALQQQYFKTRHPTHLHNAKAMETLVDSLLVKIPEQLKPKQQELFKK